MGNRKKGRGQRGNGEKAEILKSAGSEFKRQKRKIRDSEYRQLYLRVTL